MPFRTLVVALAMGAAMLVPVATAQALFANTDFLWKTRARGPVTIPVCWENPSFAPAARRGWARSAVELSWKRYAAVNFVQWDTCSPGEPGIHIRITVDVSMAPGGSTLNGVTDGVKLNFFPGGACASMLERCIRAVTVHEFGHVLGFYHEEERFDYAAPPGTSPGAPCAKQSFPNSSPQYYGAYDVKSVMSYCGQPGDDPATWKESLSPGDTAAVQTAYGRRAAGSLVSSLGACAGFKPGGSQAMLRECSVGLLDGWVFNLPVGRFTLDGRCLEASAAKPQGVFKPCATGSTPAGKRQRWQLRNANIRGFGGLCLQAASAVPGAAVSMGLCDATALQRWSLTADGEIRSGADTELCLKLPAGLAHVAECDTPEIQRFVRAPGGQLRLATDPAQCVDVQGPTLAQYLAGTGIPSIGASVQRYQCLTEQLNQRFIITGNVLHVQTKKCLSPAGGAARAGAKLRLAPCSFSVAQVFDLY